jgi:hypothetical protein
LSNGRIERLRGQVVRQTQDVAATDAGQVAGAGASRKRSVRMLRIRFSVLAYNLARSFQVDTLATPKPRSRKRTYVFSGSGESKAPLARGGVRRSLWQRDDPHRKPQGPR